MNLLVISSYPAKGQIHGAGTVGVASYAKNTILAIKNQQSSARIVILAEQLNNKKEFYKEEGIEVKRIWKRNSLFTYFNLFKEILKYPKTNNILFEFELSMFGGIASLMPMPFFLLVNKILGKRVFIVFHQVIGDIRDLSGQVNIKETGFYSFGLSFLLKAFYFLNLLFLEKAIVFDECLKKELEKFQLNFSSQAKPSNNKHYSSNKVRSLNEKITVIPHGVESFAKSQISNLKYQINTNDEKFKIKREEERKKLGIEKSEFVILCFGFIAWYKGTDWITAKIKDQRSIPIQSGSKIKNKNIKLIIAGGSNPNHLGKKFYRDYLAKVQKDADGSNGRIKITGFIQEDQIQTYYKAADLIIFPYRSLMSASGPLSIAFSNAKPFLVSEEMRGMFETSDLRKLLKKYNVKEEELIFSLTSDNLQEKINRLQKEKGFLKQISELSKEMASERNFERIGFAYSRLLL